MEINLIYQRKNIFILNVDKTYHNLHKEDKETMLFVMAKEILDNFHKRLDQRYSVTDFFYKVIDATIKDYESTESYEICKILMDIKNVVLDSENRVKFNQIT